MINSVGNGIVILILIAVIRLFTVEWVSMVVGGICVLIVLVIGFLVGIIKFCVIYICKCLCVFFEFRKLSNELNYIFEEYIDD